MSILNEATPDGVIKKLNKVQINKVYTYVIEHIGEGYTRVDLFSVISDYFDVFPNKFYNSLSNKFKDELIKELDDKYNILEKRKIQKTILTWQEFGWLVILTLGCRSNSVLWLNIIEDYFFNFFIPLVKKEYKEGDVLYHLGDVFDNRQSINLAAQDLGN